MSVEFVDTNVLVHAHHAGSDPKHKKAVELLTRLFEEESGALSTQVLAEFYAVAVKKLGMSSLEAEEVLRDLEGWNIHRPTPADLLKAVQTHRRYKMSWWDALIVTSASELGCQILWSEDLSDGQRYGRVTVRNPFR